jgi:anti-sigma regulatory factor (Ser/Thr protein kinase)
LQSALDQQTRLTARYRDALGTSGEFAAFSRLESATTAVTNCDRALKAWRLRSTDLFSFVILSGLDCPRVARTEVKKRIRGLVDAAVSDDVILLVSEVVTNAVKHGIASETATVRLAGEVSDLSIRIEVVNAGESFDPRIGGPENREPGGRGLFLVDQLSQAWGVGHADGLSTVWFEIDRDSTRAALHGLVAVPTTP